MRAARAGCGIAPDSLTRQLPITPKGDKLEKGCELCGLGGILREKLGGTGRNSEGVRVVRAGCGRETRRRWEKLGGTRAVGELGKERVVVRFGGGGIGWLGELIY